MYPNDGHGTHIAGIIAGKYGMWKKANIISIKVNGCNGGSITSTYDGLKWILNNYNSSRKSIINISLQGNYDEYENNLLEQLLSNKNVFVIVAAGNTNDDACLYSPASCKNCITVSATNMKDQIVSKNCSNYPFANHGKCVDILAPGSDICGPYIKTGQASYGFGTSDSTAIISALSAYYIQKFNIEFQKDLKQYLLDYSTEIDTSCFPYSNITTNKMALFPIKSPTPTIITTTIIKTLYPSQTAYVDQCISKCFNIDKYTTYNNLDIPGYDIACYSRYANIDCKKKCDEDNKCTGYNIYSEGCCYKNANTNIIPYNINNGVTYYKKNI